MAKDTFYFSHDYNVRSDKKIKKLLSVHNFLGYGLFWAIIEDLYNNANVLQTDYESIAFDLRSDTDLVRSIINDFDLFVVIDGEFGSKSVEERLNKRNLKSAKARESAEYRWSKCERISNALQTQSDSNAIKESKVKESKILDIPKNEENMIVSEMIKVWNRHNPRLLSDIEKDYSACLEIAYKIATVKGWKKSDVIKFKELDVINSWDKIMIFIKSDNFFKNFPLANLNNNFQMVVQKMVNANDGNSNSQLININKPMTEKEKQKAMEEWANS